MKNLKIFGDSIIKGVTYNGQSYHLCQEHDFDTLRAQGVTVENNAKMGATIDAGLKQLDRKLGACDSDTTVLFCFGGNDCDYDWKSIGEGKCDYEHRHRIAPQDFKKNYEDMIHLLQEKGAAVTSVIAPPIAIEMYLSHLLESGISREVMSEYVNSVQQMQDEYAEYGDIMRAVSKENGCEILSLRESFLALDDMKAYYSKDGMHPNEAGYALIRGDFEKYFASAAGII